MKRLWWTICLAVNWLLLCSAMPLSAQTENPTLLVAPVRTFTLNETLDPASGKALRALRPYKAKAGRYLCAESTSSNILLFSPAADSDENPYIRLSLDGQGVAWYPTEKDGQTLQADAFLRMPGDPAIMCRQISRKDASLKVGMASTVSGSYVWEHYEEGLKDWAQRAALRPGRPENSPLTVQSSLADRLWFLSEWVHFSGLAEQVKPERVRLFLQQQAIWEVSRQRPMMEWAYDVVDLSKLAGKECFDLLEDEDQELQYCRGQRPFEFTATGPAVLQIRYRPEVRLEPTPVLEETLLSVRRDGDSVFEHAIPVYPDREPYSENEWMIEAPLLRSPLGAVLGKRDTIKVFVPPGEHRFHVELSGRASWWSIQSGTHKRHIEDAAHGEENLNALYSDDHDSFSCFEKTEQAIRLGQCDVAQLHYGHLINQSAFSEEILKLIAFRLDHCSAEGEILTVSELEQGLQLLDVDVPHESMTWEDRRGEQFRREQVEHVFTQFSYYYPGWQLEPSLRKGEASTEQISALRELWYLDSIWQQLEPPADEFNHGEYVFQQRSLYPESDALPGGLSLVRLGEQPTLTSSRFAPNVARSLTLITSGKDARAQLRFDETPVWLTSTAPVQLHRVLVADSVPVRVMTRNDVDVWMQVRMIERQSDQVAGAKLVQAWEVKPGEDVVFEAPREGYSGYALFQAFPPTTASADEAVTFTVGMGAREVQLQVNSGSSGIRYPLANRPNAFVSQPVSISFQTGDCSERIRVRMDPAARQAWHVRMLLRMPRPLEGVNEPEVTATAKQESTSDYFRRLKEVQSLSEKLAALPAEKNEQRGEWLLQRSDCLCRLGHTKFAREDLMRAAAEVSKTQENEQRMLGLRERLDRGYCNRTATFEKPLPLSATVDVGERHGPASEKLRRRFVKQVEKGRNEQSMLTCSDLVLKGVSHTGCLPWWIQTAAQKVGAGEPVPSSFRAMLQRAARWNEQTHWDALGLWFPLLWSATHWEPLAGVERMDGVERISEEAARLLPQAHENYLALLKAILGMKEEVGAAEMLLPGSSISVHLPVDGSANAVMEVGCYQFSPPVHDAPVACRIEMLLNGVSVETVDLKRGEVRRLKRPLATAGDYILELYHWPASHLYTPATTVRFGVDRQVAGIPTQQDGDVYWLLPVVQTSLVRASAARPVSFHLLGPTILRVDSFERSGVASAVDVQVRTNGNSVEPFQIMSDGSRQLWLEDAENYHIVIGPTNQSTALLRLYTREADRGEGVRLEDRRKSKKTETATASMPVSTTTPLRLMEDYPVSYDSGMGTLSFLVGVRRELRDETGPIKEVDHYLSTRLGYKRRVEGADLWLAMAAEGRFRLDEAPTSLLEGKLYWITPGPELRISLSNRFAVQDTQTGLAGGNRLSGSIGRRFEPNSSFSLTPEIGAFWKWQGLNDWTLRKVPDYMDEDVYSPYGKDHPYGLFAGLRMAWQPWINNSLFMSMRYITNDDFYSPDRFALRIGDQIAFGRFQGEIYYGFQPLADDADRDGWLYRHQVHLEGRYNFWPLSWLRVAPEISYDFYPDRLQHGFFAGLGFAFSTDRGLRDSLPGEDFAAWQIDPHREWVSEW